MDILTVVVEEKFGCSDGDRSQAAAKLQAQIKTLIGVSTHIDIRPENSLERSPGKAKRIYDKR